MSENTSQDLTRLTAEIVANYVSKTTVPVAELPELMRTIYDRLCTLGVAGSNDNFAAKKPAVPPKKSIFPDYIICLEDGKKLKMLRRHLKTAYNMTPDQYRDRWSLGNDYPMVAPNYAKQRSRLAKQIGLGTARKGKTK